MAGLYDSDAATSLYGSTQEPSAPAPAPADDPIALALYPKPEPVVDKSVSEAKRSERAADPERVMYSTEKLFAGSNLETIEGLDHVAAAEVLRDMGADPNDARQLAILVHQLPQATAVDHERWIEETGRIAPADMQLARDYLKTDPRARAFIERHPGLEYEPETCRRVIALARAAAIKKGKA